MIPATQPPFLVPSVNLLEWVFFLFASLLLEILWVLIKSELLRLVYRRPHSRASLCLPRLLFHSPWCILLCNTNLSISLSQQAFCSRPLLKIFGLIPSLS